MSTATIRQQLKARGLRWTPQRRLLLNVLSQTHGHITAAELIERCRVADPQTTPSTVYRTLDVLEDLGVEFHVLPAREHGHLHCRNCGRSWEIDGAEASTLVSTLEKQRDFSVDLSHLTLVGTCADCRSAVTQPSREAR